jgi:hypothetical protein
MPSRKDRSRQRSQNELILLEVLDSAQEILNGTIQRRPTSKLCLASAAALKLATKTNLNEASVDSEQGRLTANPVEMTMIELTEVEILQLKEQNHKRIKRVVTIVAISMMVISFILVGLSLSLGPKIDQLGMLLNKYIK